MPASADAGIAPAPVVRPTVVIAVDRSGIAFTHPAQWSHADTYLGRP